MTIQRVLLHSNTNAATNSTESKLSSPSPSSNGSDTPQDSVGTPRSATNDGEHQPVSHPPLEEPDVKKEASPSKPHVPGPSAEPHTFVIQVLTILGFITMISWGYIREAFRFVVPDKQRQPAPGYAPLITGNSDFYIRRVYRRIRDCWNRPIDTRAGRVIGVMERRSDRSNKVFTTTGKTIPCVNLASYNYLGFSEDLPSVTEDNLAALERYGTGACTSAEEGGQTYLLRALEEETAAFVGKEAAVVYAMGFVTNFSGLAPLFDKDTLVVSDSLNHASIVTGLRQASGQIRVFKHNDMRSLERVIRQGIVEGKPRTHRPWKRVAIVVEGVYSMEGEILDLPQVVELKKKYKCLLYVDEAHSIGALGRRGRGVCEHHGVDPADVDVLMGTYTKSFGSIGGYIAGPAGLVRDLKRYSGASLMGDTLHSAAAQQALSSLRIMQGKDGTTIGEQKIRQLRENSEYLRTELEKRHLKVLGTAASPVIPLMIYQPYKLSDFSRELLKRNVAVVVVGMPATDAFEMRCRLCVSAAHRKDDIDRAIAAIDEVADKVGVKYMLPFPYTDRPLSFAA